MASICLLITLKAEMLEGATIGRLDTRMRLSTISLWIWGKDSHQRDRKRYCNWMVKAPKHGLLEAIGYKREAFYFFQFDNGRAKE